MPFRLIAEKYEIWYDFKRYGHLGAFCAGIPVLLKQGPDTVAKISTWIPFQKRDNPKALIRIFLAFLFKFILRRKIIAPEILGLLTQKQHIFSVTFSGTILWKTGGSGVCPNHYFGGVYEEIIRFINRTWRGNMDCFYPVYHTFHHFAFRPRKLAHFRI